MNQESFDYTYSAEQRQEIEYIRRKYLPKESDKMEQLRSLHNSATSKAKACAISVGVVGTLVLGTGMSLTMTDIGVRLGHFSLILGILLGLIGIILVALAYPVYNKVLKAERARIAPEILRLTDELLQ